MKRLLGYAAIAGLVIVQSAAATLPSIGLTVGGTLGNNGWYRSAVSVDWTVTNGTPLTGTCVDENFPSDTAGTGDRLCTAWNNDGVPPDGPPGITATLPSIRIDQTAPVVTGGGVSRGPDANGWYNHPVDVTGTGTDAMSGIASCGSGYSGPDSASASVVVSCVDNAGNPSAPGATVTFPYDSTPPGVSGATADRAADSNGWYTKPVTLTFAGGDATSGIASCSSATYGGPDSPSASVTGSCADNAGNTASGTAALRYDATKPEVTGVQPDRAPDSNGWYNHPVALVFQGQDGGSGIESCTSTNYAGPDKADVSVTGTCKDKAGHTSAAFTHRLKYDATPPTVRRVLVTPGNKSAQLRWTLSKDVAVVEVVRKPGKDGATESVVFRRKAAAFKDTGLENGTRYEYSITGYDEAGNAARATARAVPRALLFSPAEGATVRRSTVLRWVPHKRATYYNVQVWLKGKKVLSAWPAVARLPLKRTWTYNGKRYKLKPGLYRWFVWPGLRSRAAQDYGPMIGSSSFIVK
jgi:hypothetical protein